MLPTAQRRIVGVSTVSVVIVAAILFSLRRVPPHTPERSVPGSEISPAGNTEQGEISPRKASNELKGRDFLDPNRVTGRYATKASAIAQLPEGDDRLEALAELMKTWAVEDPLSAAAWVSDLPNGDFRKDAAGELLVIWGGIDPKKAATWLTLSGIADPESISTLTSAWAGQEPSAAAAWATGLADPALRRSAVYAVAALWARADPALASTWVESLPAEDRAMAATQVIEPWAASDPEAAATWMMRLLPDDPEMLANVGSVLVDAWTNKDPAAVSRWLNALPPSELREATTASFAASAAETAPTDAILWASSLADVTARHELVAEICGVWYDTQPKDFRDQIATQLDAMPDAEMRKSVYEILYEKDRPFHDSLLKLAEVDPNAPAGVEN
jgi:hypothetical protein